jgi:carboxylesterase type B
VHKEFNMMESFSSRLLPLLTLSLVSLSKAEELVASLDYGTFQDSYSSTYNRTYFQKIPFATPPTGENRFRAPQPPMSITNGTYDSTQSFDMCPQRTVSGPHYTGQATNRSQVNGSEDCLYPGLYSRPWTPTQPPFFFESAGFLAFLAENI